MWILCSVGNGDANQIRSVGLQMPHGFEDIAPAYLVDLQDRKDIWFDMCWERNKARKIEFVRFPGPWLDGRWKKAIGESEQC